MPEVAKCPECGDKIRGRSDKKFCSDACRNAWNNRQNSDATSVVRNINNALRKNRRILEEVLNGHAEGKARIQMKKLAAKGFQFDYFTSIYRTKTGSEYHFCYEYGYLKLDDEHYMVVKREQ
ncbi:MAG: hypothetical protein JNL57_01645 [Bacteroidetes bacterium]|nr:hypothetical protein [Bacteroidota bacterium]